MDSKQDLAIEASALSLHYGAAVAVDGLDLAIAPGETVALLGPNGAGKSSTISMLLGLAQPDRGRLRIGGAAPRTAVRAGYIAGILQDAGFMPGVRVRELVALAASGYPHPLAVGDALESAGLSRLAARRVDRLSGGEGQRLRFAVALVADPQLIVLDEPTRAMDVAGRDAFWQAMRRFALSGRTVLFATHYLDEVDANAGRVVVLSHGRVVADDSPAALRGAAAETTVTFRLDPRPGADADAVGELRRHPWASGAELDGTVVTLHTPDPDALVRALVASELRWSGLSVTQPSLDAVFRRLTETEPARTVAAREAAA